MSERELASAFLKNLQATTNIQRFTDKNVKEMVEVIKPEDVDITVENGTVTSSPSATALRPAKVASRASRLSPQSLRAP